MTPGRMGRRESVTRLVRLAGIAPAVLGFLEGRTALARGEETEMAVLEAALALEHEAIAIYDRGLARGFFPHALRRWAIEFRGDHLGHRDTQIAILEERGGRAAPPAFAEAGLAAGPGDATVALALEIELAAQKAYTALLTQIRSGDYRLSAAFILIDEVRHATVWRRVLGLKIY